jgi:hypothetical protein
MWSFDTATDLGVIVIMTVADTPGVEFFSLE